ncbi:MAG TPA: pyrimidine-nucleoside phosphorylase [Candidatus Gemmiger excrementavium]|uniref:Pyrimidine-nucleoside phosphorylase n=1 Tax=Candidatus Gemmiger excrementavium TaxID=2838608 RepID=A0A9D2F4M0_9FIRM|nr:pyrimidine-nucleoside phosphorylase [Candidatus Gemmiger excrementavium]
MRMYDIIAKKRDGGTLTREELAFAVNGYVAGDVPDYQMSALLMAIYLRGMTDAETAELTDVMARSGDMVDLSAIQGIKVDKHSTGGVGDKTTLVIAPIVAACDVKIAKMSGRGLGHTGGTIDKMEAVPGTRTSLTQEEFFKQVNEIGISVIGQSGHIAVADKKMYALRDVTATVGCIPLIASSIMSKKLAAGSDAILLDVTMGDGAFMKDLESAVELARQMVAIGTAHGRKVAAMITDMDKPLGRNIGNSLEVAESMAVLRGNGPEDLTEVCLQLATNMLMLAGKGGESECRAMAKQVIADGSAFETCCKMFAAQGGDISVLQDASKFQKAKYSYELTAPQTGYICKNDVEKIGNASVLLGAGRITKEDTIDFAAGITMHKKLGDYVKAGESICTFYADEEALFAAAEEMYRSGLVIGPEKPALPPLIYARVTADGVEQLNVN